jgi:hypothetical protein
LEGNFAVLEVNAIMAVLVSDVLLSANLELMGLRISEDVAVAAHVETATEEVVVALAMFMMAEVELGRLSSSGIVGIATILMLRSVEEKGIVVSGPAVAKRKCRVRSWISCKVEDNCKDRYRVPRTII